MVSACTNTIIDDAHHGNDDGDHSHDDGCDRSRNSRDHNSSQPSNRIALVRWVAVWAPSRRRRWPCIWASASPRHGGGCGRPKVSGC